MGVFIPLTLALAEWRYVAAADMIIISIQENTCSSEFNMN